MSTALSRALLLPLTCCRLLGGAISSVLMAGLFLSSILTTGEVGRRAEGEVATGIREGWDVGGRNAAMGENQKRWRIRDADMRIEYAPNPGDAPCRVVVMVINQRLGGWTSSVDGRWKGRRVFTT